jgi:hypothetical protein
VKSASVLTIAFIALAAPAAAAPLNATLPCFLRSDLRNHTVGDAHTLYQEVSGQGVYRIVMSNRCLASAVTSDPVHWRDASGSGRICHKTDVDITAAGGKCLVDRIEKMTPEEVAALPAKKRP